MRFARFAATIILLAGVLDCGGDRSETQGSASATFSSVETADQAAVPAVVHADEAAPADAIPGRRQLADGLILESVSASITASVAAGDGIITLLRIDPRVYRLQLLAAESHGARTAPEWSRDFGLTGVINASMFQAGGQSTGLMVDGPRILNGHVNSSFGAFFALDGVDPADPPAAIFGRGCPGFDLAQVRQRFNVVIQNYRLLDCASKPVMWKDPKIYSAAAVGIDRNGWVVFIHSRTPYRMREFNTMIGHPDLGLVAAMFVEGGPEASLFVRVGDETIERIGSWETGFREDDSNNHFWSLPNVIGFSLLVDDKTDDVLEDN